jgi:chemotaxis protein MotB
MNAKTTTETLPLDAIAWYAWESDEPESNWLLTYVDMLSVVLAMLVVLLGHLAAQQLQDPRSNEALVNAEQTQVIADAEPSLESAPQPEEAVVNVEQSQVVADAEPSPESAPQTDEAVVNVEQSQVVASSEPSPETAPLPDEAVVNVEQSQVVASAEPSPETAPLPDEAVINVEQSQVVANVEPSLESAPQPEAEQVSTLSPEERLVTAIENRFQGEIRVVQRDRGISLEIAEVILFDSGKADLLTEAQPVLSRLVMALQEIGEADVAVEGHTDDRPILGGPFQSNWELAAARANAVTRYLLSQGFAAKRLRSVSFADTHPVADNATERGRAQNRRVNLRVEFL